MSTTPAMPPKAVIRALQYLHSTPDGKGRLGGSPVSDYAYDCFRKENGIKWALSSDKEGDYTPEDVTLAEFIGKNGIKLNYLNRKEPSTTPVTDASVHLFGGSEYVPLSVSKTIEMELNKTRELLEKTRKAYARLEAYVADPENGFVAND